MTNEASQAAKSEWTRGWPLILTCFLGFSYLGVVTGSMNMFMEPVTQEFGWSRTLFSSGLSTASLVTACLSPFFGYLIDRFGSRRLALPGIVMTMLAISAFSLANKSPMQWLALWLLYAFISISIKTTVWTTTVVGNFVAVRGAALGITLCGSAAAAAVLPPLTNWLIQEFGWRAAYVWLGCGWGSITFLFCLMFLFDARDRATLANKADTLRKSADLPGLRLAEALRSAAAWRIALSSFIMLTLTVGFAVHQIAILGQLGVPRNTAGWLAGSTGVAGIVGQLVTGALLDRHHPKWVGSLTMAALALALGALLYGSGTVLGIILAMLVSGYAQGTKMQIGGYLVVRFCGMRSYGTLYGMLNGLNALGAACGPIFASYIYDTSGTYNAFLLAGVAGSLLCAVLLFTLPPYPTWENATELPGRAASPSG